MSKASEWAARLQEVESDRMMVRRAQPAPWCIHIGAETIDFKVDERGRPELRVKATNHSVDTDHLLGLARWILDTFGEEATP